LGLTLIPSLGYHDMFDASSRSDAVDNERYAEALGIVDDHGKGAKPYLARELHFNWWRFVEYSASGSLVLITIALLAGIVDVELLVCMFFMAATCMLLGIVAEFALRAKNVLKKVLDFVQINTETKRRDRGFQPPSTEEQHPLYILKDVVQNIYDKLDWCFSMAHALGWVCIIVPWAIIVVHYAAWWSMCDAETLNLSADLVNRMLGRNSSSTAAAATSDIQAATRRTPPDFVMVSFCWNSSSHERWHTLFLNVSSSLAKTDSMHTHIHTNTGNHCAGDYSVHALRTGSGVPEVLSKCKQED
jgi:hypothetical protein